MAVTIFRTINGNIVPMTVSNVIDSFTSRKTSKLPKFESSQMSKDYFKSVEAFTVPNAQCPVCGDLVFYYEHASGSKVYFEELGPPWTKHPCTDNPQILLKTPILIKKNEAKSIVEKKEGSYSSTWKTGGWKPSKVHSTKEIAAGVGLPKSLEVILIVSNKEQMIKCIFNHLSMKKLKLNNNSLKKALIQSQIVSDHKAIVSVHSGIATIELQGTIIPYSTALHQLKLTNIRVQLPNPDGNLTLLFATMQSEEIMVVFDMNNRLHSSILEQILRAKNLNLSIGSQYKKPRRGNNVTLTLSDKQMLEIKLRASVEINKFLSTSQKAEKISKRKQRFGGNSAVADAFAKALKGT